MAKLILENGKEHEFTSSCSLTKDKLILDNKEIEITKKNGNLLYSSCKTPDGTILVSTHAHDYVTHIDKNGKEYMLDGGRHYQRYNIHDDIVWLNIYDTDPIEVIREKVGRSGYGKNGTGTFRRALLKDMNNNWVSASIDYVPKDSIWKEVYQRELEYRKLHNIFIVDTED